MHNRSPPQKELLFHKIREEQIRRWRLEALSVDKMLQTKPRQPARLAFAKFADMWEDEDDDKVRANMHSRIKVTYYSCAWDVVRRQKDKEALKRLAESERQREVLEQQDDEKQAKYAWID